MSALLTALVTATIPLLWDQDDPGGDVTKWRVYRADAPAGTYSLLKTVTTTKTGVEVPLDSRRCYRVRAVDSLGQASPMSPYCCIAITTEGGP